MENILSEEINRLKNLMKINKEDIITEQPIARTIFKEFIPKLVSKTGKLVVKGVEIGEELIGKFKNVLNDFTKYSSEFTDSEKKLFVNFLKSTPEINNLIEKTSKDFFTAIASNPYGEEKLLKAMLTDFTNQRFKKPSMKFSEYVKSKFPNYPDFIMDDDIVPTLKNKIQVIIDKQELEKNYVHIDPLKQISNKPIKKMGVTFAPEIETKVANKLKNSQYNNKHLAEDFFKQLYKTSFGTDTQKVKSKITNFFKEVFESTGKMKHWSEIFDESKMNQINAMLDILDKKFKGLKITYGNGKNWITIDEFRNTVLKNDKLLVDDSDGVIKFSPLNKLDTNFNDNSRVLMDWVDILSDDELDRFKTMTTMFNKGEIGYDVYEKELDYVLSELKKDKSYPQKWFTNTKERSAGWFTENIIKNTSKGNQSEEVIDNALLDNGLISNIELPGVGRIKLTSLEGSPVDRLLNIDSIVQDTKGVFGKPNEFLTVQVKSAQQIKFDPKLNGYIWFGGAKIAKSTMVDIAGFVSDKGYIILNKENGVFTKTIKIDNKTYTFVPASQVKITNISK